MNNFKKAVAGFSALAIVAASTVSVNAAALEKTEATYNAGTDTVTVVTTTDGTTAKDFSSDAITTLVIDGVTATVANVATETATEFTVLLPTPSEVEDDNTTDNSGNFTVSFVTASGDFGSAVFSTDNFGGEGANDVEVTATVVPVLSMDVTNTAVSFGDMVADTVATGDNTTTIAVDTNAVSGYVLSVQNAGLIDAGIDGTKGTGDDLEIVAASAQEDITAGYGFGINAAITAAGDTIDTVVSATGTVAADFDSVANGVNDITGMSSTPASLVSSDGAVANQTTTVTYKARVSSLQAAGNYSDTITYTITASF